MTTPLGSIPFSRFDSISDSVWGFGDVIPMFQVHWHAGVNNYMVYVTGDIPVGAYDPSRLSNIGIGRGAVDAGFGYTYLKQKTGQEFSGVLGFTYNMTDQSTQYQNGVDIFDWGASQYLNKQFFVGLVGYVYDEVGCDSGSGDHVGCFQSRVIGVGPQVGFVIPMGTTQGYLNLKAYKEFDHTDRPDGWNAWVTFSLSPAPPSPSSPRRMAKYKWTARRTASAFNARIACWNKLEITPPSFSNHSRYGNSRRCLRPVTESRDRCNRTA